MSEILDFHNQRMGKKPAVKEKSRLSTVYEAGADIVGELGRTARDLGDPATYSKVAEESAEMLPGMVAKPIQWYLRSKFNPLTLGKRLRESVYGEEKPSEIVTNINQSVKSRVFPILMTPINMAGNALMEGAKESGRYSAGGTQAFAAMGGLVKGALQTVVDTAKTLNPDQSKSDISAEHSSKWMSDVAKANSDVVFDGYKSLYSTLGIEVPDEAIREAADMFGKDSANLAALLGGMGIHGGITAAGAIKPWKTPTASKAFSNAVTNMAESVLKPLSFIRDMSKEIEVIKKHIYENIQKNSDALDFGTIMESALKDASDDLTRASKSEKTRTAEDALEDLQEQEAAERAAGRDIIQPEPFEKANRDAAHERLKQALFKKDREDTNFKQMKENLIPGGADPETTKGATPVTFFPGEPPGGSKPRPAAQPPKLPAGDETAAPTSYTGQERREFGAEAADRRAHAEALRAWMEDRNPNATVQDWEDALREVDFKSEGWRERLIELKKEAEKADQEAVQDALIEEPELAPKEALIEEPEPLPEQEGAPGAPGWRRGLVKVPAVEGTKPVEVTAKTLALEKPRIPKFKKAKEGSKLEDFWADNPRVSRSRGDGSEAAVFKKIFWDELQNKILGLSKAESDRLFSIIPKGSKPLGMGAEAIAFLTPEGTVITVRQEGYKGTATRRPSAIELVQPTKFEKIGKQKDPTPGKNPGKREVAVEELPFIVTLDNLNKKAEEIWVELHARRAKGEKRKELLKAERALTELIEAVEKYRKEKERARFPDLHEKNIGITSDGTPIILDPGHANWEIPFSKVVEPTGAPPLRTEPIVRPGKPEKIIERFVEKDPVTTAESTPATFLPGEKKLADTLTIEDLANRMRLDKEKQAFALEEARRKEAERQERDAAGGKSLQAREAQDVEAPIYKEGDSASLALAEHLSRLREQQEGARPEAPPVRPDLTPDEKEQQVRNALSVKGLEGGRAEPPPVRELTKSEIKKLKELEQQPPEPPKPPAPPSGPSVPGGDEILEPRLRVIRTEEIRNDAIKHIELLAAKTADEPSKRLYKIIRDMMEQGIIDIDKDLLARNNMSVSEFIHYWSDTYSKAGKQMQQLSVLKKRLMELDNPVLNEALDNLQKKYNRELTAWENGNRFLRKGINFWRAALISPLRVAVKAAISQTGVSWVINNLDTVFEHVVRKLVPGLKEAKISLPEELKLRLIELIPDIAKGEAGRNKTQKFLDALSKYEEEGRVPSEIERALLGEITGEGALSGQVSKIITFFMSQTEKYFRKHEFAASMEIRLAKAGLEHDLWQTNPEAVPHDIAMAAVTDALISTFALNPPVGTFLADYVNVFKKFPILYLVQPFPRMMYNSLKMLVDHNPLSAVRAFTQSAPDMFARLSKAERESLIKRTGSKEAAIELLGDDKKAELLSKAMTGTAFLFGATIFAYSQFAGDKWNEIKQSDGRSVNIAPLAPLATYFAEGKLFRHLLEASVEERSNYKNFWDSFAAKNNMSMYEVTQLLLSVNRLGGTAHALAEIPHAISTGTLDAENAKEILFNSMSELAAGFSMPLENVKMIFQSLGADPNMIYSTRADPAAKTASRLSFIPGVADKLTPKKDIFTGKDISIEDPAWSSLAGLGARTKTALQSELDKKGIDTYPYKPHTGYPEIDEKLTGYMGEFLLAAGEYVINSPTYKSLEHNRAAQRFIIKYLYRMAMERASNRLKKENPEMTTKLSIRGLGKDIREMFGIPLPK